MDSEAIHQLCIDKDSTTEEAPGHDGHDGPHVCHLLNLPLELLGKVMGYLLPETLSALTQTCRSLYSPSVSEHHWRRLIQENLPGHTLTDPGPAETFRQLYSWHHQNWFLVKQRIWLSNASPEGEVVLIEYDPNTASIRGSPVCVDLTESDGNDGSDDMGIVWLAGMHHVSVTLFAPSVFVHRQFPNFWIPPSPGPASLIRNALGREGVDLSIYLLSAARPTEPEDRVWPPKTIPGRDRALVPPDLSCERFSTWWHQSHNAPNRAVSEHAFMVVISRLPTQFVVYGAVPSGLLRPTVEAPWNGLWVGDYLGHGAEFILIYQERALSGAIHGGNDATQPNRSYRTALRAVKLTGDRNVPRGKVTFTADDIGDRGLLRIATERPFEGARVVRSRGHVASNGFREGTLAAAHAHALGPTSQKARLTGSLNPDSWISTELIMISHDLLAHKWKALHTTSYYRRVQLDKLHRLED